MTPTTGRVVAALVGVLIVAIAATLQQAKALGLSDQVGAILVIVTAVLTAVLTAGANALPSVCGLEVATKPTAPPAP